MFDKLIYILKYFFLIIRKVFKTKNKEQNTIVVMSFKFLGDTVFTIPALELLKMNLPDANIVIFCYRESKVIYDISFHDLHYELFEKQQVTFSNRKPNLRLISKLRKYKPKLLFDLTCEYQSALSCLFSGADKLIGFNTKYFEYVYDCFVLKSDVSRLEEMHLEPVKKYLNIQQTQYHNIYEQNFNEGGRILINPFAGWHAKEWNFEKYINLAEELKNYYEVAIICQANVLTEEKISDTKKRKIKLIISNSVEHLIDEIKKSSVMISNDTGSIYIAALLGKATFTIYGPTNPKYSLPLGKHHRFVQKRIKCSPEDNKQYCHAYGGRNCQLFDCMKLLSYESVRDEALDFLESLHLKKINLQKEKSNWK